MIQTTARPWLIRHWLFLANLTAWTFALLPVLAPVLMALGLVSLADLVYSAYTLVCHQWAHRSFFLFGPQATYSLFDIAEFTQGSADLAYVGSRKPATRSPSVSGTWRSICRSLWQDPCMRYNERTALRFPLVCMYWRFFQLRSTGLRNYLAGARARPLCE